MIITSLPRGAGRYFRKERVEILIKEGLSEFELIELFGSNEEMVKSSYQYYYGVNTFEAAKAKILNQPILNKWQQKGYNRALKVANDKGLILVSDEYQYKLAIEEIQRTGKKSYDYAILEWKHSKRYSDKNEVCGHVWENSVRNIKRNVGACPICDSRLVNQKITNAIVKYIFNELGCIQDKYKTEHSLIKIFPELKGFLHHAVHVNGHVVLNLRDKNGNQIKIAIEYQGQQHDPDPNIGFEAYKAITKNLDVKKDTEQYSKLLREWRNLIKRDANKVKIFANKNEEGYYLIVVPYNKKPHERQEFIINEFERQTEIKLRDIAHKNWNLLRNLN